LDGERAQASGGVYRGRVAWVAWVGAIAGCSRGTPQATNGPDARAPAARPIDAAPSALAAIEPAEGATPVDGRGASEATSIATMKLLDPGQPPRRRLRYQWNVSQKERLAVELRTSASTEAGDGKQPEILLPPVHIDIAIDPESISADGDLHYGWAVRDATMTSDVLVPSQVADGMRAEVSAIDHLRGTATVTSRGITKAIWLDPSTVAEAGATGQMIEQVRQTLRDVAAPLPDEDVGRGARWQKHSLLDAKQTRITQTETFTLLEMAGNKASLDDVLAQTAPAQALRAPGMSYRSQARMESMLASGNAKIRVSLSQLVPQTKFDGTTTMVVSEQSASDTTRRLTMIMRIAIAIEGTTR
jgi:hypothetical protein